MSGDQKRILIVEDDEGIARLLTDNLKIDGFNVKWAATAHEALVESQSFHPDLVLLDITLAGQPAGFDICSVLRQGGRCGVIIVSARSQRDDKLRGLGAGADDYVTKPFDMEELAARINAVLRRTVHLVSRIRLADVEVDFEAYTARRGDTPLHLTHYEFEILRYLAERRDRVVRRDELLREVWKIADGSTTRAVDFAVARLRQKIEPNPPEPRFLRTIHGEGYSLTVDRDPR
jgi:two-component system alkaline phosphatase synthesis response regulator PhoP